MWQRSSIGLRALKRLPIPAPQPLSPLLPIRTFTQTPTTLKKRKIAPASDSPDHISPSSSHPHSSSHSHRKNSASSSSASSSSSQGGNGGENHSAPDPENPLDFSSLTSSYAATDAHFKVEVQQVLHGGRFNPDALGAVPVTLKAAAATSSPGGQQQQTFQLREVAQIVPRSGRTISLLVNDKMYIRDIMSAIQKNPDFNQQPQRSEDNELELFLKVELERKEDLVKRVKEACQHWRDRVRQARTRHEKTLHEWKKNKAVLPDVVRKAEKELQKLQDRKMKEIDQEEAQAIKQLDRR